MITINIVIDDQHSPFSCSAHSQVVKMSGLIDVMKNCRITEKQLNPWGKLNEFQQGSLKWFIKMTLNTYCYFNLILRAGELDAVIDQLYSSVMKPGFNPRSCCLKTNMQFYFELMEPSAASSQQRENSTSSSQVKVCLCFVWTDALMLHTASIRAFEQSAETNALPWSVSSSEGRQWLTQNLCIHVYI